MSKFFTSNLPRTVLLRTFEVAAITTAIALVIGFTTAWVVARAPRRIKSVLIIASVFPLLTSVVVRSFAWLVILGKNGILNKALLALHLVSHPLSMLYTEGAVIVALVYLFTPLIILTLRSACWRAFPPTSPRPPPRWAPRLPPPSGR